MGLKLFKICFYIILISMILFFYTRNINLFENKFYKNIKTVDKPDKIDVLVNKNNKLEKNYVPKDLVKINHSYSYENKYLRKEANKNLKKLIKDSLKDKYKIVVVSSYRSYFYQRELFDYYVKNKGLEYALKASAKPGHSEHQTGLSIDVMGSNDDYNKFEKTKEFKWMKDNSYKYGFILRYPKGKENITGFKYEPWHYRYVGKKLAKYLYDNNLTLEEFKKEN